MFFHSLLRPFLDERERWFLWLPLFMAAGIALYTCAPFEPSVFFLGLAPFLILSLIVAQQHLSLRPVLAAMLALALGFNAAQLESKWVDGPMLETKTGPVSITGRLMHVEVLPQNRTRLTIKNPFLRDLPQDQTPRHFRVKTKVLLGDLPKAGQRINLWGPLWPPGEPVASGAYNFRRHAFFKQIGGSGFAYGKVRKRKTSPPPFFWDGFYLIFEHTRHALLKMSFENLEGPKAAMTAALLSGSQASIGPDVMKAMRASGLSHLLSISGIHVSIVALLIYIPLRFLLALFPWLALRVPIKKMAAATAILGTSLYVLLVGPETPTVRSALMTAIVMFAIITNRKAMSMRLVALSAMPIMLLAPSAVMGPSFQMSFAAVLAMVAAFEKKIDVVLKEGASFELPDWLRGLWKQGRAIILTSLIATAATTPFALLHFQTFSFYGVIANIIAIPLTSFWIMPNLLLIHLAAPLGLEAPFVHGAGFGVELIIELAQEIASWPYARIDMPPMPTLAFFLALGGGIWLCLWQQKWRFLGIIPLLLACLYPFFVTPPSVFIAAEENVWAVRLNQEELAVYGKKKEGFLVSQWKQLSSAEKVSFVQEGLDDEKGLSCEKDFCLFEKGQTSIVFLLKKTNPAMLQKLCETKEVVVAPFDLPSCTAPHVIDAEALYVHGSHSIIFEKEGLRIQTVREKRGTRPWSLGWLKSDEL